MDLHIGQINSTVRATDSEALLSPALLRQITAAVISQMQSQSALAERVEQELAIVNSNLDPKKNMAI